MAQPDNAEPHRWRTVTGFSTTLSPIGLLGDITNITPSFNIKVGIVFDVNANNSMIANFAPHSFAKWSHHFRGTDNHRAIVSYTPYTLGVKHFFSNPRHILNDFNDFRHYFSVEVGVAQWKIDSSTYVPLDGSRYTKPIGAIHIGTQERDLYFEVGIELTFMETNKIGFKKYSGFNPALTIGFGFCH